MENSETKQALELCQNLTEEERRAYDSFWDLESLNIDRENTVKEMGRVEGRAEGAKAQAIETARQMKTDGLTVEVISKYTGLDPDEIAKL
jgi:predicted transposase/invertase (TIGR01784 family)